MPLSTDQRREEHIRIASNDVEFEKACVDIYERVYNSPGSRRNGRHGQYQQGVDIFVTDWTGRADGRIGTVWVQTKYTDVGRLKLQRVLDDIDNAAARVQKLAEPDVYLFIVATNAPNDAKLDKEVEIKNSSGTLPFRVEVHASERLCRHILHDDWLWERYNTLPGERIATEHLSSVEQFIAGLERRLAGSRLDDARRWTARWTAPSIAPSGDADRRVPPDSWRRSYRLRAALLDLYRRAADASAARPLLDYECSLTGRRDAGRFLDYLLAERIVTRLQPTPAWLPTAGMPFAELLCNEADAMLSLAARPDEAGCLALLLVMETDDIHLHDAALAMLRNLIVRTRGTYREQYARVAHAAVRYYYVHRHGWSGPARFRAVGDMPDQSSALRQSEIDIDAAFPDADPGTVRIAGFDPLAAPARWHGGEVSLVRELLRIQVPWHMEALPRLQAQCALYSAGLLPPGPVYACKSTGALPSTTDTIIRNRIVDAETLLLLEARGHLADAVQRYTLLITGITFERLLCYRAFLDTHLGRTGDLDGAVARKRGLVKSILDHCKLGGPGDNELSPKVWISPVYDDPPIRLTGAALDDPLVAKPFSLARGMLANIAQSNDQQGPTSKRMVDLESFYLARYDEWAMACLLALHRQAPVLTYDERRRLAAQYMGIGWDDPQTVYAGISGAMARQY